MRRTTDGKDRPVARRRMTLRRIDPWSVLKFGAVVNVCLLVIVLLGSIIVWFAVRQLGIIDQACGLATDVGFENCAVNGGNLFRYLLLLGLLWIVIQTGLFVFFAFLHNLIADLVGGVAVTLSEDGTVAGAGGTQRARRDDRTAAERPGPSGGLGSPPPREGARSGVSSAAAGSAGAGATAAATGGSYSPSGGSSGSSGSSGGERSRDDGDAGTQRTPYDQRAPSAPPTTAPRRAEPRPGSTSGGWPWDPQPREEPSESGTRRPERDQRDDDQLFGPRDER